MCPLYDISPLQNKKPWGNLGWLPPKINQWVTMNRARRPFMSLGKMKYLVLLYFVVSKVILQGAY